MNAGQQKKFIRQVVRRVHPDLFADFPQERAKNTESLKVFNNYVDNLANRVRSENVKVEFFVKDGSNLTRVEAELPASGNLGPLFYAFGLINYEQLRQSESSQSYEVGGESSDSWQLMQYLQSVVQEAVKTAEEHEVNKRSIRDIIATMQRKFGLASVQVGMGFTSSMAEQKRQLEALQVLDSCLTALTANQPDRFEELSIRLYHPDSCPFDTFGYLDHENGGMNNGLMESYIADDGCLHIVADRYAIQQAVSKLDLERARLLTKLTHYWLRRVRDLTPALQQLLRVDSVWCDTRSEHSSQRFVLWAGYILEQRDKFEKVLAGCTFSFSVLVHSDTTIPMVDFLITSSVLQVRSDCPPQRLLEFLQSDLGVEADQAAQAAITRAQEEQELLERVRGAFGAKQVIRMTFEHEQDKVFEAAYRLLENADKIKSMVNLEGTSIAIDNVYELWESGVISIPFDFSLKDLQPQLRLLLSQRSSSSTDFDAEAEQLKQLVMADPTTSFSNSNGNGDASSNSKSKSNGKGNGNGNGSSKGSNIGQGASHGSTSSASNNIFSGASAMPLGFGKLFGRENKSGNGQQGRRRRSTHASMAIHVRPTQALVSRHRVDGPVTQPLRW